MTDLAIFAAGAATTALAAWRIHRLTQPAPPTPTVRLRRSTVHEDWEIIGATPPPALDATWASPTWGQPALENR